MKSAKLFSSRAIHIAEILIILFVGTVPSVVSAGLSNYEITTFPPIQCALNRVDLYYEVVVPVVTSIAISEILMLLTLYKIHVVSYSYTNGKYSSFLVCVWFACCMLGLHVAWGSSS